MFAYTALGDVETVADLLANVLRPIAEHRGLISWADICAHAQSEWFPSRIALGEYKGRNFLEARTDDAWKGWIDWLAGSKNARTAQMGRWYLNEIERRESRTEDDATVTAVAGERDDGQSLAQTAAS